MAGEPMSSRRRWYWRFVIAFGVFDLAWSAWTVQSWDGGASSPGSSASDSRLGSACC
jgi:hypothetical protein